MAEHNLTAVGFEPTQLALVELESTPLDHSGKLSWQRRHPCIGLAQPATYDQIFTASRSACHGQSPTVGRRLQTIKARRLISCGHSVYASGCSLVHAARQRKDVGGRHAAMLWCHARILGLHATLGSQRACSRRAAPIRTHDFRAWTASRT